VSPINSSYLYPNFGNSVAIGNGRIVVGEYRGNYPKGAAHIFDLNGNLISEYRSINEAHRSTNIPIANISRACSGKLRKAGGFVWEIKGCIKENRGRKSIEPENRKVIQMDLNNNIINTYNSIREAHNITGIPRTSISNCCFANTNNHYSTAYKFKWVFKYT
jgi:hypothetical protein